MQGNGRWRTGRVAKAVCPPGEILVPIILYQNLRFWLQLGLLPEKSQMSAVLFPWKGEQPLKLCLFKVELNFLP